MRGGDARRHPMKLPRAFEENVSHALGNRGREWIENLPSLLASCEREYDMRIGPPFELSYNYVAPVTLADGSEAVLKLSPHGNDFRHEVTATRYFAGRGMARLLHSNEARGVALLQRLRPGRMLVELDDDDRQTEIAADVMLELRREPPSDADLPTPRDWFQAFALHRSAHGGGSGPLPPVLFERGETTYEALLDSAEPPVLLHGDLHHYNILSAQRAPWLAIDPHGLVGEPAFETGAFFGNPFDLLTRPDPERIVKRRADILAERLDLDRAWIIAWGFAYQTLSAVWSAERGGTGWGRAIGVAEILATMM